jgi:hypothetical protein
MSKVALPRLTVILRFKQIFGRRNENIEENSTRAKAPIEETFGHAASPTTCSATLPRFSILRFMHMLCHQPNSFEHDSAHQIINIEQDPAPEQVLIEDTPEPEGANDPNFWKSRIILSAWECYYEDFELSAPPFPYKKRWDPACKRMAQKADSGKGRTKRHNKGYHGKKAEKKNNNR